MSDQQSENTLQVYVQRLEELSKLTRGDQRHTDYVRYINAFLSVFGDERIYVVGSTGERTKLRWTTDSGDADFIMVSGKLGIPIKNIRPRDDTPVYVWIKGDDLSTELHGGLVEGQYLCPETLRTVNPRLFTILRGVYLEVTATNDGIPGRESRVTTTACGSKVGLARDEFRNLNISEIPSLSTNRPIRFQFERSEAFNHYIRQKWQKIETREEDVKLLKRILKLTTLLKVPGTRGEGSGQVGHFAVMVEALLKRPPVETIPTNDEEPEFRFYNDLGIVEPNDDQKVWATYEEKSSKDFVPALRVLGTLPCMDRFMERVLGISWPSQSLAKEIYKTDVFIVSRKAPLNPDGDKDFCLSFNLAEIKLSQNLPGTARQVFLVLKSYLKGMVAKKFKENNKSSKLKTYHLKMTMFWVCEREELSTWAEGNMLDALTKCLAYLFFSLEERSLLHYFVQSNLFVGFEDEDFQLLIECVQELLSFPIKSIEQFFEMDRQTVAGVWLSQADIESLLRLQTDGGRNQHLDQLEEAGIDILRGVHEGPRDVNGRAPIVEAILKVIDIFLEDEQQRKRPGSATKKEEQPRKKKKNDAQLIAGFMNAFVTAGGKSSHDTQEASARMDLVVGLGSLFPEGKQILSSLGGKQGLQNVLQSTSDDRDNGGFEMRAACEHFLTCSDDEEHELGLILKQKVTAYFLGREGP